VFLAPQTIGAKPFLEAMMTRTFTPAGVFFRLRVKVICRGKRGKMAP